MDDFEHHIRTLESPASTGFSIAPNDDADLTLVTRAIYVGQGGSLVAILADDLTPVTFSSLGDGSILPVRVRRVLATGTTADDLVGLI